MNLFRLFVIFCVLSFGASPAAAIPIPAEGTCICDQYGCSKVVNSVWTHVNSCGGLLDQFNGPVLAQRNAAHHLVSLMRGDLVVIDNRALNYDGWTSEGDWKKYDGMGQPKRDKGWIGPDGKKYDSPEQGWHMRGGRAEPATVSIGAISSGLRVEIDSGKTIFSALAAGRESRDLALRVRYSRDWDDWGLAVEAPVTHQSNNAGYANLDNDSLGVTVMPVYHLMRASVQGVDANIAGILGYSHHWYKGGTALAVAGFDNPSYLEAGVMAAIRKPAKLAVFNLGLSHEQVQDQSAISMAGRKSLGFSTLQGGVQIPLKRTFELGADLAYAYIHGLPAGMDAGSWKGTLALQYRGKLLNYGGGFSRSWGNQDYRTTGFNLWLSRSLP